MDDYLAIESDTDFMEYVIDTYGQQLLRYCHNILCDYHEAEDVVQTVFIKIHKNRYKIKKECNFKLWIYKIAYNTCIDHIRKRKVILTPISEDLTESSTDSGFTRKTSQVLQKLTVNERALLYSRILEERTYCELSEIYNISEAAVRKRYERAKKNFIKVYNEWSEGQ